MFPLAGITAGPNVLKVFDGNLENPRGFFTNSIFFLQKIDFLKFHGQGRELQLALNKKRKYFRGKMSFAHLTYKQWALV